MHVIWYLIQDYHLDMLDTLLQGAPTGRRNLACVTARAVG